jgi:CubicO group peptidase (beta-lactamase class C family)
LKIYFEIPRSPWDGTLAEPITLQYLISHTAGFEDQNIGVFVLTEEQLKPLSDYLAEALPARVFPPGQISSYSNYGSSLAAYIVQRIAGMPFADYVEKQIFAPLGITGSTFRQPVPDHLLPQLSAGYQPLDELYLLGDFELCQSYPAGSLSA